MTRTAALSVLFGILAFWGDAVAGGVSQQERVDHRTQVALSLDAHRSNGKVAYTHFCTECHGARALGNSQKGVPALAGQRYAYLIRQLANFSGAERDNSQMHAVTAQPELRRPQVWADIAAYLNRLPAPAPLTTGPGHDVALGRGIFHEQCAACHGEDAGGDADGFVPALRHQHYRYLREQMHKLAQGYRHNVDESLMLFLRSFDERDIGATADYLSRLGGSGKDRKRMRDDGVVVD